MKCILGPFLVWTVTVALSAQQRPRNVPKAIDDNALRVARENRGNGRECITCAGNYAETCFSLLKQINTANVTRLSYIPVWLGTSLSRSMRAPGSSSGAGSRDLAATYCRALLRPRQQRRDAL